MKVFILLISTLAAVHSRPQNSPQTSDPSVELEKQTLIEVTPNIRRHLDNSAHSSQRNIEDNTKEILDKIAEVNKKHGLKPRKQTPNYFHFPFSYSRSQEEKRNHETKNDNFKFTNSPFSNPIFEYLERERHEEENNQARNDLSINRQAQDYDEFQGYEKTIANPEVASITKEDIIPGQYIKRKIVHQQTFLIPNPNLLPPSPNSMISQNMPPYMMQTPMNFQQVMPSPPADKYSPNNTGDKKDLSNLEKQTVDNIKNIVSNTQMLQSQTYPYSFSPYSQYPQGNLPGQPQYDFLAPNPGLEQQNEYNYRIYGPYTVPNSDKSRQNWNWPGANYFPIYIRDPFLQMYNAITSMIEYGPNAGQANPCNRPNKNKGKGREETPEREGKIADKYNEKEQITLELGDKTASSQITIYGVESDDPDKNNTSYLDIENIDIGENKDNNLRFTVSLTTGARTGKETENKAPQWDKLKQSGRFNSSRPASKLEKFSENSKDFRPSSLFKPQPKPQPPPQPQTQAQTEAQSQAVKRPVVSPPARPGVEFDDEIDEDDKADEVSISNDGNKKLFSRDNTGSGIFIHKLKVRKGGVAIAGPGGIATAGSGGTAIVGPNGVAYTHPDSLAIAGSGTKVVAVDPNINLGDLINSSINNKTSGAAFPPSRIGKVVAVGPVVYYNKGKPEKVTIIPFYGGGKGQVLQIVETPDGKVTTTIIKRPENYSENPEDVINAADLENPPLPSKYDSDEFGSHIRNIQKTALRVIGLQEIAKQNGKLSESEEAIYKENMDALSQSAQNLAKIQEEANPFDFQSREGLSAWFERKATSNKDKNKKKQEEEKRKKEEEERKKKEEEERKKKEEERKKKEEEQEKKREEEKRKEEEEKRKEEEEKRKEEEKEEEIDDEDSIAINLPPEDASVAEAKPVGLAIAGEGGVAASKPIATAVVGPGGLAIARPVGTAIAGVSPDQALVPIYADGYIAGTKPKGSGAKLDSASQFLSRLISKYHQN